MRPLWLAGAVALAVYLVVRRRRHGRITLAVGALAAVGAGLIGAGVVELPNVEHLIEDAGQALGKWTYLAVGILAFLETGAFIGLVAPGETTVIVGGLVAGQGVISLSVLIAIVWACAVAGDLTSYALGRRLGRDFMVRHGGRVKITEERLEYVERFFERRGGTTILIGRFIGLVRAIAPFIAGASRMPLRKFLPYDILGAGLWATTFCVLGFVFWRSFDRLTAWVSRGLFAFALVVALIAGIVFLIRVQRDPALRERTVRWIAAQLEKPLLRPFAPALRAAWHRVVRPAADVAEAPARFVWNRLTPGDFGLELTTLLAAGAVGSFAFFLYADLIDERDAAAGRRDRRRHRRADRRGDRPRRRRGVHRAGLAPRGRRRSSPPRRRGRSPAAAGTRRSCCPRPSCSPGSRWRSPRSCWTARGPSGSLVETTGAAYPSAHAAYAVFYVACAVVLVRAGSGLAARFAVVTFALVLAVALALSRVLLRASHLSDVTGGAGLATAVLALLGLVAIAVARLRHNVRPEP